MVGGHSDASYSYNEPASSARGTVSLVRKRVSSFIKADPQEASENLCLGRKNKDLGKGQNGAYF